MISRLSSISIATSMGLHVLLVVLVVAGMLEHTHKETETPPIKIELIQPKKFEPPPPPPKPEPKQPEPKQPEPKQPEPKQPEPKQPELPKPPKVEPVKPEPPAVEPRAEPPKVEPVKPEPPAVEPRAEQPKPEPTKPERARPAPPSTAPQAVATPTAPEPPPKPAAAAAVARPVPSAHAPPAKTGVDISASYRGSNVQPVYPTWSLKNREQGTVVLRVLVKSDGTAGNVELKSSSGYPRLDQSAIQAVKTWRYIPATRDGKPIDELYELDITFKNPNS